MRLIHFKMKLPPLPHKSNYLKDARRDVSISGSAGGLITAAILITAGATIKGLEVQSAADSSLKLKPIMEEWALIFISIGLFAAGFSSACRPAWSSDDSEQCLKMGQ